jgi:hypothetical protein
MELIVDYRKRRAEHSTIHVEGAVVEQVESFKFLGVHFTKQSHEEGMTTPLPPQEAEKIWHGPLELSDGLQFHH